MSDLDQLMEQLRQAGRKPDRGLLDRVKACGHRAVRPLIEMAIDEDLNHGDPNGPGVWAPLHAVQLLGELKAPEAVAPLLTLFGMDDDWLSEAVPEACGQIGGPALAPLRTLLLDRQRNVWAQVGAAEALGKIGQYHPDLRSEAVSALTARLDPAESQVPDDEMVNAFAITSLLDLEAVEAEAAIRRAFAEDRVDTSVVRLEDALEELGLPPTRPAASPSAKEGMRLRLHCTACQYEREHDVGTVYCDMTTAERRRKGEPVPYSEFVICRRITCPKCGAVDQYELSGDAHIALIAEVLKKAVPKLAGRKVTRDEDDGLVLLRFTLADGREMHPLAAREMYRQQVEAEPDRADLRVRHANILRFLGYREEATAQYRAALSLDPRDIEAQLNLAYLAQEAGDVEEARRLFVRVVAQAPYSPLAAEQRMSFMEAAHAALQELPAPPSPRVPSRPPASSRPAPREAHPSDGPAVRVPLPQLPVRKGPKIGRNDPCPCGSGKKYKKCCGR